jgi:uncharacterized protein YciI
MQWLYLIRVTRPAMLTEGPTPDEQKTVGEHFRYWQALGAQGVAALVGRTQTNGADTLGLAVFEAADEAAARAICEADPVIQRRVMRYELLPYRAAILGRDVQKFAPVD